MKRLQPAIFGGLFIGVVSSLPLVGAANACCCLWVVVGGLLTVYLQRQAPAVPGSNPTTEAVVGGLLAGLVGGVIHSVLSAVLFSMAGAVSPAEVQQALDMFPQLPPETRDRLIRLATGGGFLIIAALVTWPVFAVFSMLGALLGLAIFKKPSPPAQPPPVDVRIVDDVSNRPPQ